MHERSKAPSSPDVRTPLEKGVSKRMSDIQGNPRAIALSTLALALAAIVGSGSAAAAERTDPAIPAAMRVALQRDLGISPAQVGRYVETERLAIRRQGQASRALGNRFGGAWLERDATGEFQLVIATTDRTQTARARALGGQVRVVARSLSQLEGVVSRLNRVQAATVSNARGGVDRRIHSWHIDLPTNTVVVTTDPSARDAAVAFVAASGADAKAVRFETSRERPQPVYDISGGDRYNVPGSWCSIGFSVTQGGNTGFVTAGHCSPAGTAVSGFNGVAIGTFAGSQFPGSDYAVVHNTSPSWAIQPWVNNYAGGNVGVVGGMEAPVGGAVCRSGARTNYRCGTITAKNVTVNYAAGATYGMVRSSACVGGGDSGGSFLTPGGEAQGVTSGGQLNPSTNENCSIASPVTYHQPLQPILNAYSLVLTTTPSCGRLNPSQGLATGASVTSCDGRFTFVIQGDGNLVLYKAGVGPLWASHVGGSNHHLEMQSDGNLVVYNGAGQAVWHTSTGGKNGAALFVQNDGNVVLYSHQGAALWSTGTYGN